MEQNKNYKKELLKIYRDDVFEELMVFWEKVEKQKADYKIFISQKCYVLYKCFLPLLDSDMIDNISIKITDTAIPVYINQMINRKVLVIDDVYIHGRAVSRVHKQLRGVKDITYYVFAKNSEIDIPQDKIVNDEKNHKMLQIREQLIKASISRQSSKVNSYLKCNEYQWKRISDLVMRSLWHVNQPYTSYLPTITFNNRNDEIVRKFLQKAISYQSDRQKELEQNFLYSIHSNEYAENKTSIIHYCFVMSENEFCNNCRMIPMVFFDCENTCIDKRFIYASLAIIYSNKFNDLKEYFLNNGEEKGLISMLKYLIFCVGYLKSMQLLKKNKIENNKYIIDYSNAEYSFGKEINFYLKILQEVDVENVLKQIEGIVISSSALITREDKLVSEQKILLEGLVQSYAGMEKCGIEKNAPQVVDVLARYFKFNNMKREELILKSKLEGDIFNIGLKFSDIKDFLKNKNCTIEQIVLGLMHEYNLGAATIDFLYAYDNKKNIVGINMYWRAGEQSYKCIAKTYVPIVYYQNLYKKVFTNDTSDFLCKQLLEIADKNYRYWRELFSCSDWEMYCSSQDNVYNAFDIEKYCEKDVFKYLGYIAEQMYEYVIRGYFDNKSKERFIDDIYKFMKNHTEASFLMQCKKILQEGKDYKK